MKAEKFEATLMSGHKEDAAEVPFDPGERWSMRPLALWAGRKGFPVCATLNGTAFESAIVARSKRFWLLVPAAIEESTGTTKGDVAAFTVAPNLAFKPTA